MPVTKDRREQRVSSQINSGGQVSMKMLIKPSKIADIVNSIGGKEEKAPMVPVMVTTPLQLVHLDFTSFETTTNLNESPKIENVLIIINHFMRYTRAYVTKDRKVLTAARILYEGFISIFGAPKRILMDQGNAFTSEVVEQLCSQFGISQSTMTAYHPRVMVRWNKPIRLLGG